MMTAKPREPKCHELKCWPEHFQAIIDGIKTAEVRINDRDYRVGDSLLLREYVPRRPCNGCDCDRSMRRIQKCLKESGEPNDGYTGRDIFKTITHIIDGFNFVGISPGYVALSIKEPE